MSSVMTLNLIPEKMKTKSQRKRNMKNQNTETRKLSFIKAIGRKCRLNKIMTTRE